MARSSSFVIIAGLLCAFLMLFNVAEASTGLERRKRKFHGKGTWFIPSTEGGSQGACGDYNEDDDMIVAMNKAQYGKMSKESDVCGKMVRIKYKNKTVKAKVTDACPSCDYGSLDLTQRVFRKLEKDLDVGIIKITWEFV